jgi:hypothetical protein
MELPSVKSFNVITMFVDHYGKQAHIVPTTDKVDLDDIAEIHYCNVFQLHSIPPEIHLGLKAAVCIVHNSCASEMNRSESRDHGQTEHINRKVAIYLCMFCNCCKMD